MNLRKSIALSLSLATLSALTAAGASAATLTRGTFTLPAQAYWNDVLLQPGDYTLSISGEASGVRTIALTGDGVDTRFLAPSIAGDFTERSVLKMDQINGTYVVRELDAAPTHSTYHFGVSKSLKNQMARGEALAIPVIAGQ